jgi:16S rRNA U516 pseudouridylate synthase RsuA-like enzyme
MKFLNYLQKTLSVSRREFTDMLQQQVMFINDEVVTTFTDEINI